MAIFAFHSLKILRRRWKLFILLTSGLLFFRFTGFYLYFCQENYFSSTTFASFGSSIVQLTQNKSPEVAPLYTYKHGYKIQNVHKCQCHINGQMDLIFMVKSSYRNRPNREAIRQTWGNQSRFENMAKLVFLLALPVDESHQSDVENEAKTHDDVIQGNFADFYYNNTLKTIMAFDWLTNHCACVKFAFFVDDDFYVSTKNALNLIRAEQELGRRKRHLYMGHLFFVLPVRFYFHKFHVNLEEYPFNVYPPFINAGAFILKWDTILAFHYAAMYTKPVKLDDVFVGILAKKVNVTPTHNTNFYPYKVPSSAALFRNLVASHGFRDPSCLTDEWQRQVQYGNA